MYDTITLFTTSLCNLKCNYCYICKDESLAVLDKELEESYKDPYYYFNLYKEYSRENISKLKCIYLFGGEPFLKLDRVLPTLRVFIENCPELKTIFIVSNYAGENVPDAIEGLMNLLSEYPGREFEFDTQISWDGPTDIMDTQRNIRAVAGIESNLHKLLVNNFYLVPNVNVKIHVNATLEFKNLCKFLDKDYIKNYVNYFEDKVIRPIKEHNSDKITWISAVRPKLSYPAHYTQEDGKLLAQVIQNFNEIDLEDSSSHIFHYDYGTINCFYNPGRTSRGLNRPKKEVSYCPYGSDNIGLLPNNQYCNCVRTFTDPIDLRELLLLQNTLLRVSGEDKLAWYYTALKLIHQLAKAGQILTKYLDEVTAEDALQKLFIYAGICYYYNHERRGNYILNDTDIYKLWLNGALDKIDESIKQLLDRPYDERQRIN